MVIGLGIDLLETDRLASALEQHGEKFCSRVFTELELSQCEGRRDRVQALAARFAAKEACMKALGTGWAQGLGFRQIEIKRTRGGKPELQLHAAAAKHARALGVKQSHVSLTHQPGMAAALVVLEG